jgi:hypothetical protein
MAKVEGSGTDTAWITKPDGPFRRGLEAKVVMAPPGEIFEIVVLSEFATKRSPFASNARLPGPFKGAPEANTD